MHLQGRRKLFHGGEAESLCRPPWLVDEEKFKSYVGFSASKQSQKKPKF